MIFVVFLQYFYWSDVLKEPVGALSKQCTQRPHLWSLNTVVDPWVINCILPALRGLPYKSDFNFHHCVWLERQTAPVFRTSWVSINVTALAFLSWISWPLFCCTVICTSFSESLRSCNLGTLILLEGIYWGFENSDRGTRWRYRDKKNKRRTRKTRTRRSRRRIRARTRRTRRRRWW